MQPTEVTKSQPYNQGMSHDLNAGGSKKMVPVSEEEMNIRESRDNAELQSQKSKLEALQKQKPPTNQEDLVKYLM